MAGPLAHLKVLDLSRVLAGPWAGQILGDLGADVIKIEHPARGDDTRGWGPPFLKDGEGRETADAAYFLSTNRNKRSLALDIADPRGAEIVRRLAAQSDVVLENFKVGGLKKYGLDYEAMRAVKPDLVYCSITGFGQEGPRAARAGYDFMIQGMAGLMSITGLPDGVPGGGPIKVGVALSDIMTGLYAVIGILAALAHRDRTGEGQQVDMALFDVTLASLANQATNYLVSGKPPQRLGNAHPNIVPYEAFRAKDDWMILAIGNDVQFKKFCEVAGAPELAQDPRFAANAARVHNRAALTPRCGRDDRGAAPGLVARYPGRGRRALWSDQHAGPRLRRRAGRPARLEGRAAARGGWDGTRRCLPYPFVTHAAALRAGPAASGPTHHGGAARTPKLIRGGVGSAARKWYCLNC